MRLGVRQQPHAAGHRAGFSSAARPLRLFERPEPIEAIAQVPDGPPVRFSWRHTTHQVVHVEGPERIAMEWWRDDRGNKLTRDYFRVESEAGARVWLYREGLYGREAAAARAGICTACLRECEVMSAYAELAVTTNFSFLRGAPKPKSWLLRAKELGLVGLGIADRNSVAGVVRAHAMAKVIGFKIAVGARLVFSDGSPDILAYPEDRAAWGRLTRLLTVGKDRAEKGDCILGLPDLLEEMRRTQSHRHAAAADQRRGACQSASPAEGSPPAAPSGLRQACFIAAMIAAGWRSCEDAADAAFVPLIAVNDVLYHVPERRALQDVVTCIREHRTLEEAGRLLEANAERHLKSAEEMTRLFGEASKAIGQTTRFLKRCRFSLDELKPHIIPANSVKVMRRPMKRWSL